MAMRPYNSRLTTLDSRLIYGRTNTSMTTRLDLRTFLRERLEDTSPTPLWDDATLNDALWNSLIRYGVRFPLERSVSVPVSAGSTSVPVSPMIPKQRLLRVLDAAGDAV